MNKQVKTLFDSRYPTGANPCRLTRIEFSRAMSLHVKAITNVRDASQILQDFLASPEDVCSSECEDALQCLVRMAEYSGQLYAFIEKSERLPLSVVPLRLSLMMTLKDVETQTRKLERSLAILRDDGWVTLFQSNQEIDEIKQELDALQAKSNEVLDQVNILLDRARFKELEYSRTGTEASWL